MNHPTSEITSYSLRLPSRLSEYLKHQTKGKISANKYLVDLIKKELDESRFFSVYDFSDVRKYYIDDRDFRINIRIDSSLKKRLFQKSTYNKASIRSYIQLILHKDKIRNSAKQTQE